MSGTENMRPGPVDDRETPPGHARDVLQVREHARSRSSRLFLSPLSQQTRGHHRPSRPREALGLDPADWLPQACGKWPRPAAGVRPWFPKRRLRPSRVATEREVLRASAVRRARRRLRRLRGRNVSPGAANLPRSCFVPLLVAGPRAGSLIPPRAQVCQVERFW